MPTGADRSGRVVLDTSAYSWLRSGHEEVLDVVAAAEVVAVPTVVLGELEAAFELGSRQRENATLLEEFLAEPFVSIRAVTREVSRHYGHIYARLRRSGRPIPINDVWIAATTLEWGGELVTFDHHFRGVRELRARLLSP